MTAKEITIKVWQLTCERCGWRWTTKNKQLPKVCVSCKSHKWNEPRKKGK